MTMVTALDISEYLDNFLHVDEFDDVSYNGLQVENSKEIKKVGFAVDADLVTFEKAKDENCDMVVVHHGIAWKYTKPLITGLMYERVKYLIDNNIALYGVHLPLDVNDLVGNNVVLSNILKLKHVKHFGDYHGIQVGLIGEANRSLRELSEEIEKNVGHVKLHAFGELFVNNLAVVTGSGGFALDYSGFDTLLTGEVEHHHIVEARDKGINIIEAGHYFTEVFGVKELMKLISSKFGVETVFLKTF